MKAPVMNRERLVVNHRVPKKWMQVETWIRPRLLACLPQQLKKQLTQRGVQGVRDEVQDILFMILKACCPGIADEKSEVLRQVTDPTLCSKAETALNEPQKHSGLQRGIAGSFR